MAREFKENNVPKWLRKIRTIRTAKMALSVTLLKCQLLEADKFSCCRSIDAALRFGVDRKGWGPVSDPAATLDTLTQVLILFV
jgi:hypothetical protein